MSAFKIQGNSTDPTPYVIYPVNNRTAWLINVKFGPFLSQVVDFTVGAPPRVVYNTTSFLDSIAVDGLGRVWFSGDSGVAYYDPASNRVQNVTSLQSSSWFIAIDSANHIWVTLGSNEIARYDPVSDQTTHYPVPTLDATLQGITVASDGRVWFAEAKAKKLAVLDPSTSKITEYAPPLKLFAPAQLAVGRDGLVWFTDHGSNQFGSFNPRTGNWEEFPIGYCPGDACAVGLPNAIALDSNGKVWFAEHLPGRVARFDPDSRILTEYILPTPPESASTPFPYTWWAWPGPENLVWFTSLGFGEIGYVNSTVPVPFTISAQGSLTLAQWSAGSLLVTLNNQGQRTFSLGVSTSLQDWNLQGTPFLSGTLSSNVEVSAQSQVMISLAASWNAPLGSRFVTVTVSDGQVSVSLPVQVNIVPPILLYLTIVGASAPAAAFVFYVYRRRKHRTVPPLESRKGPPESIPILDEHIFFKEVPYAQ